MVILFDYREVLDCIDHQLLTRIVCSLDIPRGVAPWVVDFLGHRYQRVKLSVDCFSEWGPIPAGVLQGTKLGPSLFLLMKNDSKYLDDKTVAEIVPRDACGHTRAACQSRRGLVRRAQKMQLNADKCKVMVIEFKRHKHDFIPLTVHSQELETVDKVKVLGVIISYNLK